MMLAKLQHGDTARPLAYCRTFFIDSDFKIKYTIKYNVMTNLKFYQKKKKSFKIIEEVVYMSK